MTIQLRLTLWYTALLGVTLILFSVLVYYALSTNLNAQVRQDAQLQAEDVARFLRQQLDAPRLFSTLNTYDESRDIPVVLQLVEMPKPVVFAGSGDVQLFDIQTGKVLRHTSNLVRKSLHVDPEVLLSIQQGESTYTKRTIRNGTSLQVYSIPLKTDKEILGLQIIQSTTAIELALKQVSRYLMFGTALSLVLAAIVGAYLARQALRPINAITHTANSISRTGDLGRRLNIPEDASEVGQLAATFNEMLDRIQRLFKTQERLIADVSHELRTPLTTIQGNVELLQRVATASPESGSPQAEVMLETAQEVLHEVENDAMRMARMISDLLLLAQADSGGLTIQKDTVEIDTLLLDVYRQTLRITERIKGTGTLEVKLGGEDQALVLGDRERLRQLLLNLTENAVKYTPDGGTVILGLTNRDGWVQVSIRDTGIGISAENQKNIFDRFYRTDKARSRELVGGSGLGLSIAQWVAKAHGGHIQVESQPQKGSTFTVWLPEISTRSQAAKNTADAESVAI